MISVETAGALVASTATAIRKPQPVRALRAFLVDGERIAAGRVVEVTPQLAAELVYAQKAERVDQVERTEPAEAPQPKRKTRKGDDQ